MMPNTSFSSGLVVLIAAPCPGLEADRVVNDARQQFERDLKAEQAARTQAEAATSRTQEHLQAAQTTLVGLEKALTSEQKRTRANQ